jgi:Transglutaminase elicitor
MDRSEFQRDHGATGSFRQAASPPAHAAPPGEAAAGEHGARGRRREKAHASLFAITPLLLALGHPFPSFPGRAPYAPNDRPADLVDRLQYERLADMDDAGLRRAELPVEPWSSDYWPMYVGLLGRRYADPDFPASTDFTKNYDYVTMRSLAQITEGGDQGSIDALSPAEKYDLLVGDASASLTASMWREGKRYADENNGEVERWMGICEGWAAASYMMPRPRVAVTVLAADGATWLRFYPADIKALASLLWSKSQPEVRFIGSRSNEKNPETDAHGRPVAPATFDTNPGTFHVVLVNQIGVSRRSFVMDTTYDYEVWNQPVMGYSYGYFDPQQRRPSRSLVGAMVRREAFTRDPHREHRSSAAAWFVGVTMHVRYLAETSPSHALTDDPTRDAVIGVDYTYDLELNAAGRILGGEWYTSRHPDFLWTPEPGARAVTPGDAFARGAWDPSRPLPASWRSAAARVSPSMMPLAKIVERLIELANGG